MYLAVILNREGQVKASRTWHSKKWATWWIEKWRPAAGAASGDFYGRLMKMSDVVEAVKTFTGWAL